MSNVTVIIPLHEFDDKVKQYLQIAIKSLQSQLDSKPPILIVYTHRAETGGILEFIKGLDDNQITTIKNEEKSDFCSQINFGVKNISTSHFSILEYDDEYNNTYFRNVDKHVELMKDVTVFLPITIDVDDKNNNPLQLVNQNIWSNGYVGENGVLGYLNIKSVNEFSFYTIGGSVINKADYLAVGGLKSNIVLAFTFEFILRILNNGYNIYTIPKFGYKHTINRDGSLFMGLGASLTQDDRKFWFDTASKESNFFNDRFIEKLEEATVVETTPQ